MTNPNSQIYLKDGIRVIDFVLAYEPYDWTKKQSEVEISKIFIKETSKTDNNNLDSDQSKKKIKALLHGAFREDFECQLRDQGLVLEYEDVADSQDGRTAFIKIHATWEALARTADMNRVKMPIKKNALGRQGPQRPVEERIFGNLCTGRNPFDINPKHSRKDKTDYFTAAFNAERSDQFLIEDEATFFSPAQRIRLTWEIILETMIDIERIELESKRKGWNNIISDEETAGTSDQTTAESGGDLKHLLLHTGNGQKDPVGIKWFIKEKIYTAAFPLHDADRKDKDGSYADLPPDHQPLRWWLRQHWARFHCRTWYKYQPLNEIRNYYGEKVAIYFAWLGFYTRMLILPAVVGLACFLAGVFSFFNVTPRRDLCYPSEALISPNVTICRLCAKTVCPFKKIETLCSHASLTYIIDNYTTVFFSLFVSVWAVVFLELWKRYQAELGWAWDVLNPEIVVESIRPEYQTSVKGRRQNPVTEKEEPHLPKRTKAQKAVTSCTSVAFMILVVMALLAGVIFYRIVGVGLYHKIRSPLLQTITADMLTMATGAVLNLVCIIVLSIVYRKLAWYLTFNELPRTDTNFENSFTYKMFIFEFVNSYVALFYIAFLKGKIFGAPTDTGLVDRCTAVGCLVDVCLQLAIVLILKLSFNNFVEIALPVARNWWKRRKNIENTQDNEYTRWEKDFDLSPWPQLGMVEEYLEIIIQYGFVTMFVAAFPLAPLFALLNNIIEIRLDAYKLTMEYRRPVPARAKDIGAWMRIMEIITKIAVITNGLVIAFTSDFIDRLVYVSVYSKDGSLNGYIKHVFSLFNTTSWADPALAQTEDGNKIDECWYRDYRSDPDGSVETSYTRTTVWWHVLVARLFFVLIFEHVVFLLQSVIQYFIPDVPEQVSVKIERENFLAKQAFYINAIQAPKSSEISDPFTIERAQSDPIVRSRRNKSDIV